VFQYRNLQLWADPQNILKRLKCESGKNPGSSSTSSITGLQKLRSLLRLQGAGIAQSA
jgi:hypothetical protein